MRGLSAQPAPPSRNAASGRTRCRPEKELVHPRLAIRQPIAKEGEVALQSVDQASTG